MKNRIGHLIGATVAIGAILGAAIGLVAQPMYRAMHAPFVTQLRAAPSAPGTNTASGAYVTATSYPYAAVNASDVWGVNGASTYTTASLAGLVANSPVNVVAATSGKKIVVVGYDVDSNVSGSTVTFQDETAVTPVVFDGHTFAANDHREVFRGGQPIFKTSAGAALDIKIVGTSDVVSGSVTYYLE